jgi:hypothetical protein
MLSTPDGTALSQGASTCPAGCIQSGNQNGKGIVADSLQTLFPLMPAGAYKQCFDSCCCDPVNDNNMTALAQQ